MKSAKVRSASFPLEEEGVRQAMDMYDYDEEVLGGDEEERQQQQQKGVAGMQFCSECNNLLYPQENRASKELVYRCKRCHHRQPAQSNLVFTNHVKSELAKASTLINAEISKDPTLPRNTNVHCSSCGHGEAVYLTFPSKSEDEAMKLLFFCSNPDCNAFWRDDGSSGRPTNAADLDTGLYGDMEEDDDDMF